MKTDEELKKTFKIFIDEEGILNLIALKVETDPKDNARSTELVEEAMLEIFKKDPEKQYSWLIEITPLKKIQYGFSQESRKIGIRIASNKQLRKVGVIFPNMFVKTIINFMAMASNRKENIKCFSTREEAIKWLKE